MSEETTPADYVQAAAIEAIKAFRAFLDVAETVVRDPGMAATVGKAFADAASSAFRTPHDTTTPEGDDDEDEAPPAGGVRRIHLTD